MSKDKSKKKTTQDERNPRITFRFASHELRKKAERLAEKDNRTLTGWLNQLIREAA